MKFTLLKKDINSKARAGHITTTHSYIETPVFMPVGTLGSVKGVHQRELTSDINSQIILSNTYHLILRPGLGIIKKAGGLHKFIGWDRSLLTDSGGYQVYSLNRKRILTEEGVSFSSHIDGAKYMFTPENVIEAQRIIGPDIMMAFDECTPPDASYSYTRQSVDRTHRWLKRCIKKFNETENSSNEYQSLFPIVQGSIYKDLRKESAEFVASMDMPGNAIGGVCHPTGHLYEITEFVCDILPKDKPRYLMGVGTPKDILECISCGVDMFDCVMPTRNARNGSLFTTKGIINIKNRKWKNDFSCLDEDMGGYVSTFYSKSYLNHLINVHELLGSQIATIHNLTFYKWLTTEARKHILEGTFLTWKNYILDIIMRKI